AADTVTPQRSVAQTVDSAPLSVNPCRRLLTVRHSGPLEGPLGPLLGGCGARHDTASKRATDVRLPRGELSVTDLIVSADSHVVEPADLWLERLPKKLRDRAPHRRTRDDGIVEFVIEADGNFVPVITTMPELSLGDAGSAEKQPN